MTRFDPEQFPSVSDFFIEDEGERATCRDMAGLDGGIVQASIELSHGSPRSVVAGPA